jgi:hypothetical protein
VERIEGIGKERERNEKVWRTKKRKGKREKEGLS